MWAYDYIKSKEMQGICAGIQMAIQYINKVEHKYVTRGNLSMLRLPEVRAEAARKTFMFQSPASDNEDPVDIQKLNSLIIFKHKSKEH